MLPLLLALLAALPARAETKAKELKDLCQEPAGLAPLPPEAKAACADTAARAKRGLADPEGPDCSAAFMKYVQLANPKLAGSWDAADETARKGWLDKAAGDYAKARDSLLKLQGDYTASKDACVAFREYKGSTEEKASLGNYDAVMQKFVDAVRAFWNDFRVLYGMAGKKDIPKEPKNEQLSSMSKAFAEPEKGYIALTLAWGHAVNGWRKDVKDYANVKLRKHGQATLYDEKVLKEKATKDVGDKSRAP